MILHLTDDVSSESIIIILYHHIIEILWRSFLVDVIITVTHQQLNLFITIFWYVFSNELRYVLRYSVRKIVDITQHFYEYQSEIVSKISFQFNFFVISIIFCRIISFTICWKLLPFYFQDPSTISSFSFWVHQFLVDDISFNQMRVKLFSLELKKKFCIRTQIFLKQKVNKWNK